MENTCLNCLHEPEWEEWQNMGGYKRCLGKCKWSMKEKPAACYQYYKKGIIRYSDDSGIHYNCPQWKPKE